MRQGPVVHSVRTRNEVYPVLRDLRMLYEKRRGPVYTFIYAAHRMCPLVRERAGLVDPEDFWVGCQILRAYGRCEYFKRLREVSDEDVLEVVVRGDLPEEIVSGLSREARVCPFFALARLAERAEYVVATYPYVLDPSLQDIVFGEREVSDYSVVVDEAHMLTIPSRVFSDDFSQRDVRRAVEEVRRWLGGLSSVEELLSRIEKAIAEKSREGYMKRVSRDEVGVDESSLDILGEAAVEVKKRVFTEIMESRGVEEALSKRVYLVRVFSVLSMLRDPRYELFVTREPPGEGLARVAAVDYSVVGESLSRFRKILLMSGTPPSPEFFRDLVGIGSVSLVDTREFTSWRPTDSMAVVVATELSSRYEERRDPMYRLYAEYIDVFRRHVGGVKLVVYPSYDFMKRVLAYLETGEEDYVEGRGSSYEEAQREVLGGRRTTLHVVAGGKMSEGVEFVEDGRSLVKAVFIAGVPYPQPDDYLEELVRRAPPSLSRDVFRRSVLLNEAYVRASQAIGRSVRGPGDRALVVLGDRRFMSRELRELMGLGRIGVARDKSEFREMVRRVSEEYL